MREKYESPKITKKEEDTNYVFEQFDGVGFNIKEFPELHERLVELNTIEHFKDAATMAEIVDCLWPDLEKDAKIKLSKEELKLACLFHDIGKSGPVGASQKERLIIEQIFNPIYFDVDSVNFQNAPQFKGKSREEKRFMMKDLTISEILEIENFSNNEEIKQYLKTLKRTIYKKNNLGEPEKDYEDFDIDKHTMIQLWRQHDDWTLDLLKRYQGDKISKDLVIICSSHHTLDGSDPALIDGEVPPASTALETIDKYLIITLVDKYQAFIDRDSKSHAETIQILDAMVEDKKKRKIINHENKTYKLFKYYIGILAGHKEIAEIIKPTK